MVLVVVNNANHAIEIINAFFLSPSVLMCMCNWFYVCVDARCLNLPSCFCEKKGKKENLPSFLPATQLGTREATRINRVLAQGKKTSVTCERPAHTDDDPTG